MLTTEWFAEMASSFLGTIAFIILMIFAFMFIFIFVGVVTPIFMFYKDTPIDKWGKLKNAILQNFHSLYLLVLVIGIIITHSTAAISFANPSIAVIVILINILIGYVFAPSSFSVPFVLLKIYAENNNENKHQQPPEL